MNKATAAPADAPSLVGAGLLIGFGIGSFVGYLFATSEVHVPPQPAYYSAPAYAPAPAAKTIPARATVGSRLPLGVLSG